MTTPAVVPTPIQKPIAARTSQEAMAAAPIGLLPQLPLPLRWTPRMLGHPCGRISNLSILPVLPSSSAAGQPYSKRMDVIQRTAGPLTRFQQNKMEKDVGIRNQVIDRLQGVLSRADMLDNMLTAGQLDIAVDPSRPYQLVTRVLGRIIPQGLYTIS